MLEFPFLCQKETKCVATKLRKEVNGYLRPAESSAIRGWVSCQGPRPLSVQRGAVSGVWGAWRHMDTASRGPAWLALLRGGREGLELQQVRRAAYRMGTGVRGRLSPEQTLSPPWAW